MYGSLEESTPAAAPALGPAEIKFVRKLMATSTDDTRPAGVLHEPQELSTSTLAKLEAASDEVELQASVWDASLFLFNPVAGRSASVFCGNTCCVPTGEWDGTYDKMKKWANEGRIPQWVLDKASAAAGD